jgi:hypothetical protein
MKSVIFLLAVLMATTFACTKSTTGPVQQSSIPAGETFIEFCTTEEVAVTAIYSPGGIQEPLKVTQHPFKVWPSATLHVPTGTTSIVLQFSCPKNIRVYSPIPQRIFF